MMDILPSVVLGSVHPEPGREVRFQLLLRALTTYRYEAENPTEGTALVLVRKILSLHSTEQGL